SRIRKNQEKSQEVWGSVQNRWHQFLKLVAPDFPDRSRKPREPELRKFEHRLMFPKLKQVKLTLCEHLLIFLFSFINLLMFGPRYVVSYPRALIMPKVHSLRFQSLMHLFRGSSLHILGL